MADIYCFPQERNVGKARHVAHVYLRKRTDRDREGYWCMTVSRLAQVMRKCGFSDPEIDRQVTAFRNAVQDEINTTHYEPFDRGSDNGPGVA